jgi:ABC-type transporter MlaC component
MTNNKQQTEINAVEYLDKVNQFAKENNTGKPKQQTAIEWLFDNVYMAHSELSEKLKQAKEMEKEQIAKAFDDGDYNYHYSRKTGNDFEDGKEYFNEVYG